MPVPKYRTAGRTAAWPLLGAPTPSPCCLAPNCATPGREQGARCMMSLLKTRQLLHRVRHQRPSPWALLGAAAAAVLLLLVTLGRQRGGVGVQAGHRKLSSAEQRGGGLWGHAPPCKPPALNLTSDALGKECTQLEDVCFDQVRRVPFACEEGCRPSVTRSRLLLSRLHGMRLLADAIVASGGPPAKPPAKPGRRSVSYCMATSTPRSAAPVSVRTRRQLGRQRRGRPNCLPRRPSAYHSHLLPHIYAVAHGEPAGRMRELCSADR